MIIALEETWFDIGIIGDIQSCSSCTQPQIRQSITDYAYKRYDIVLIDLANSFDL